MATIQGIYVALFGRPADPAGLAYFNQVTNDGTNLAPIINSLAGEPEYLSRFTGKSNAEIITEIYLSIFNRPPDAAGLQHFLDELAAGRQTIATIAVNILDGATGADLQTALNKIATADAFTASLDTAQEIAAYNGLQAAARAGAIIDGVTSDSASIPTPAEMEIIVRDTVFPGSPTPPTPGGGGGGGDTIPPTAPELSHYDNGTDHHLFGWAEPGSSVLVYNDGALIGTVQANGAGEWMFLLPLTSPDGPYNFTVRARDASFNLSPFSWPVLVGTTADDFLTAPDDVYSLVFGRAGNDTLFGGNIEDSELQGGAGDDHLIATVETTMVGGEGNDILDGTAASIDVWYRWEGGPHGVVVDFTAGTATDTFGNTDTIINAHGVAGTDLADILTGSNANQIFRTFGGNDVVDGGDGYDEIHYQNDPDLTSVEVDLATGTAVKHRLSGDSTDTLTGIEDIRGSRGSDVLRGSDTGGPQDGFNSIRGLAGDDVIDGRGGFDRVDYSLDARYGGSSGVTVSLVSGTATDGFGDTDTLQNIEDVRGTEFNDVIIGDSGENRLDGFGGSDELTGNGDADVFTFRSALYSSVRAASGPTKIMDFNPGEGDLIDLTDYSGDGSGTLFDGISGSLSLASFETDVTALLTGENANFMALITANGGNLSTRTFLIIDDGSGAFEAGPDIVVELAGTSVTTGLSTSWLEP